jgi:hypothetical protein
MYLVSILSWGYSRIWIRNFNRNYVLDLRAELRSKRNVLAKYSSILR